MQFCRLLRGWRPALAGFLGLFVDGGFPEWQPPLCEAKSQQQTLIPKVVKQRSNQTSPVNPHPKLASWGLGIRTSSFDVSALPVCRLRIRQPPVSIQKSPNRH